MNSNVQIGSHERKEIHKADEELLVASAKEGDEQAFATLWSRHSKIVLRKALRITGNYADAEDAVQDAFLKAFVHLKSFDQRSKFSTWVVRVAINSALTILRRKRAHPEALVGSFATEASWELADQRPNFEDQYCRHELQNRLDMAIRALPKIFREVTLLYHARDHSIAEIAGLIGISVAATKSRLFRARTALRAEMMRPEAHVQTTGHCAIEYAGRDRPIVSSMALNT